MATVGVLVLLLGAVLIYAGVTGQSIVADLRSILNGEQLKKPGA